EGLTMRWKESKAERKRRALSSSLRCRRLTSRMFLMVGIFLLICLSVAVSLQSKKVGEKEKRPSRFVVVFKPTADKGVTTGDFKGGLKEQDPDGTAPIVWVGQQVWWDVQQVLIRFDLTGLSRKERIRKATLEVYVADYQKIDNQPDQPMELELVSLPPYDQWDEKEASFEKRRSGENWSEGNLQKSLWKVLGKCSVTGKGVWCRWDVTEPVRDHHEGRVAHSGFVLRPNYPMTHLGQLTTSPARVGLATREHPDREVHPRLVIEKERLPVGVALSDDPPPTHPSQLKRMPPPPYRIWYQCPFPDDLRYCNVDASVGTIRWAFEHHPRSITSLMWVYGPNLYHEVKDWNTDRFVDYYGSYGRSGYAGIAMDEWNQPDDHPYVPMIAEALRVVKKQYPKLFIAVWVTEPTPVFRSLVAEGAIDLALIQGYTFVPEHPQWAISWDGIVRRLDLMKKDGLLPKTIVCLGMISPTPDSHGRCLTPEELTRYVKTLAQNYPSLPGIAFYGVMTFGKYKADPVKTRELVLLADRLAGQFYPDRSPSAPRRHNLKMKEAAGQQQ
ncbi:MAG: DNRLRE domain-containing protein, partial [Armatimonadetes bacterium]|nr:DNRLRE domain-containing protein [Armatimonadota bacterium]MDW8121765.1 DNRLRE domain-containing protein [Armatimonadota bacterium]